MSMNTNLYMATSPYYTTAITDKKFLDVMTNRPIPYLNSDVYWTITQVYEYRPDMLAHDLYSNSKLWWVFAQRNPNKLKDPYFDFTAGLQIYIPKIETLKQALGF